MVVVEEFLAVGTQMKIERPGKATVATPCSTIEPPSALLKTGDFIEVTTPQEAKRLLPSVHRIIDLGEILVPFGEFVENNHVLPLSPYSFEWWQHDLDSKGVADAANLVRRAGRGEMSPRDAFDLAERTQTPLCPAFNLFWHDLRDDQLRPLGDWLLERGRWESRPTSKPILGDGVLVLPMDLGFKEVLVELGALHRVEGGSIIVERAAYPLLRGLGLDLVHERIVEHIRRRSAWNEPLKGPFFACELASRLAGIEVRPRGPVRIGARMGRPEKADARKMSPPPHALFPIANAGGPQRLVTDAAKQGKVAVEYGIRKCPTCNQKTFRTFCDNRHHTVYTGQKERDGVIDVASELRFAKMSLGLDRIPDEIKGVMGTISESKTPEPLEKGILRAKHGIWSFEDGTARFDMTDTPLTHFKPKEIGTSVEKLRALGYTHDIRGAPLESADQMLELRVQDIIPARSCLDYLLKTAKFVDELLERFYKLPAYYKAQNPEDMVGHLIAGLAPHTSGAVVGRIIGSTAAQVCWAHPFFHTAKRRNCDGDEDAVMLLMDGLLNFSRVFIPAKRGGLMDLPLVLSTRLDPPEIDTEAHNVDVGWRYPKQFYEATARHAHPKEVQKSMDLVEGRLGTEAQYEGFGFTHDTDDINAGVAVSAYKTLGTMMEKMLKQLELGVKLRGVDAENVARRVLDSHFLPDMMGNLKAFSRQKLRCTKCGAKYRRPPLAGVCTNDVKAADGKPRRCGYKLILTVTEASVRKYLEVSRQIATEYNLGEYTQQRLLLIERNVTSMFTSDKVKKAKLSDFL
jgi:DNA polymerase II large subunit